MVDKGWDGVERRRGDRTSGIERHIQSVVTAVMGGILIWLGNTNVKLLEQAAATTEQIKSISLRLERLERRSEDQQVEIASVKALVIANTRK